jgi:uncharacterized protein (DUF1501 family)
MKCSYACGTSEHLIARRNFLGGLVGGMGAVVGGLGALTRPSVAKDLTSQQKRVLVIYMSGGLSQLESWDPKPKTDTGGPFRAIPTSVPGVHISELLPQTAKQMHQLAIVRSINTKNDDHAKGNYMMTRGRREMPGVDYPVIGAVCAKALAPEDSSLPGHIYISPGGTGTRGNDAAYLGPKYSSVVLGNGQPPQNSARPDAVTETADKTRNDFRRRVNDHFASRRRTAETDAYTQNYERALELMKRREIFDITHEPAADRERYGAHDFGRHCLLARRLLENGITFVQVSHSNYDTHNENFNFHLEQLGEFDRSFAALIFDLADRGMLDSTLVVVMSEFGRTPGINLYYGRDHWGTAWSVCLAGGRIHRGAVIGKTNERGTEVVDREVDHGHLWHTYLEAVGLDSHGSFNVAGRDMLMADPEFTSIKELLT